VLTPLIRTKRIGRAAGNRQEGRHEGEIAPDLIVSVSGPAGPHLVVAGGGIDFERRFRTRDQVRLFTVSVPTLLARRQRAR